jgi:hypothetical protein
VAVAVVRKRIGLDDWSDIVSIEIIADEIESFRDATTGPEAAAEVGMIVVHTGIDDRYVHATAREAELTLRYVDASLLDRRDEVGLVDGRPIEFGPPDLHHGIHGLHARQRAQLVDVGCSGANGQSVEQITKVAALAVRDTRTSHRRVKRGFFLFQHAGGRPVDSGWTR